MKQIKTHFQGPICFEAATFQGALGVGTDFANSPKHKSISTSCVIAIQQRHRSEVHQILILEVSRPFPPRLEYRDEPLVRPLHFTEVEHKMLESTESGRTRSPALERGCFPWGSCQSASWTRHTCQSRPVTTAPTTRRGCPPTSGRRSLASGTGPPFWAPTVRSRAV